jgi:hypothetical protein
VSALSPQAAAIIEANAIATSQTMVLRRSRFTTGRGIHELQVTAFFAALDARSRSTAVPS